MDRTLYLLLADAVLLVHLLFIVFVLAGGLLALRWPRIAWLHVPAAAWGALIEFMGWICPLTPLENRFLRLAGETAYQGDFVARYLLPIIYPAGLTSDIQAVLGGIVLVLNAAVYAAVLVRRRHGNVRHRRYALPDRWLRRTIGSDSPAPPDRIGSRSDPGAMPPERGESPSNPGNTILETDPMRIRTLALLLTLSAIAVFAALNWSAIMQPTALSLGVTTVEAPLGLVMLGLTALLATLFLVFAVAMQASVLLEARRHARELQASRALAEQAEASRLAELRAYLESELQQLAARDSASSAALEARLERLELALRTAVEESGNALAAYIGEFEDRIEKK